MEKMLGMHQLPQMELPQYNFRLKAKEFNKSSEDFTIWFLEGILENNPNHVDCLMYLGNVYTATGRYKEGLKVDQNLVRLRPEDPVAHYNLACSYSLLGDVDAAFKALEEAVALGYKDLVHLQRDSDLENLRKDHRYQGLIDRVKISINSMKGQS
ncbi:MAG: tetratricopeptide repeat protein [Candidatus Brocadiaceae bacterium]|nr:tetratricopeptide repeat protein [Candidatus Brocadiaceae bacterium]